VVAEAAKYLGTPYLLGGLAECVPYQTMDCNCLTATAFAAFGIYLPEGPLESQMAYGTPVSGPPQAGDLLAWSEDGSGYITHLGIAMGDGTTIHASAYAGFVVSGTPIDSIPGYMGAVRLL
jgi:cell wall-associated NlpC family hydrolase